MAEYLAHGTGRRKTSVARVHLALGTGVIKINGKKLDEYFTIPGVSEIIEAPLVVTDCTGKFDALIRVRGGGITGQAHACRHGISRALLGVDESNRAALRANGFLTRDSRMVERKKFGQRGARRKFQFSKR